MRTLFDRFSNLVTVKPDPDCWDWKSQKNPEGYGVMWGKQGSPLLAHRVSFQLFVGEIPERMLVMHTCDNRACVNPKHLRLGTDADNVRDAAIKNRMAHKLSLDQVHEIRRLYAEGLSQGKIARMFGITSGTASRIISRKRRQHI